MYGNDSENFDVCEKCRYKKFVCVKIYLKYKEEYNKRYEECLTEDE